MTATDPVCGMQVDAEAAPASTEYQGKTFYFCYTGCKQKFDAEPARYLAPKSAMGFVQLDALAPAKEPPPSVRPNRSTGPESLIEYTCPMDPEIRQMGPGVCPKCGMALEPVAGTGQEPNPELTGMRRRFWISAALTLPLVVFMFMGGLAGWIQFLLSTPVVVWAGAPFFQRGWASVTNRRLNMFTLIALGTGIAYASSLVALLRPGLMPTYFEPAAVIITLVLLGQILELRARARTASALKSLLELTPKNARLIVDDDEHEIPVDQIRPGDRLRVRPGEKVPVDGAVLEGSTTINESMITGEPMPVDKASGDTVAAGTVNTTGSFIMQAERVGSETLLSQIVRLVGEAQRTRAPVQRVADIVAGYFVPAVVVCAVVTFIAWLLLGPEPRMANAFVSAVSVLIIACPCALGLATPMSVMVGTGRGARSGVLIRNAEALETLQKADILIVDKTGTLTEGKPAVTQVQANATSSESDVLRLAASLEQASEHPLAAAVVKAARERRLALEAVQNFESIPGQGVRGIVAGHAVAVGNNSLIHAPGQTGSMLVSIDGQFAGAINVSDRVKESTHEALRMLRREGIQIVMATGDRRSSAEQIASTLGIDQIRAEVLPQQKAEVVREFQARRHVVAMAGDGINDAPALTAANVGIAMGTGTDIAIESAAITLVHGDLRAIVRAIHLSRKTMRNIRQNLFFAFVYNIVGVPIAAGVLYPVFGILLSPMIASAAMTFSSVSVISNALRLRTVQL